MTAEGDFTEEEWQELRRLPLVVAAIISAVDYSTVSEGKEYEAFAAFIRKAGEKRRQSAFVSAILDQSVESDKQTFQELCTSVTTAMSGEKPVETALLWIKKMGKLADERLDKREDRSYKEFALDVALAVARAHKESTLPFASSISKVEDFHIRRMTTALGL